MDSPPPPPPPPSGDVDYSQIQPHYGQPYGAGPQTELAGFWIRFVGSLIDGILLSIVGGVLAAVVGLNVGVDDLTMVALLGNNWLTAVIGGAYFTYFHGSTGQTLGQKVVSIKVVDQDAGTTIDYGRALVRFLFSYISGIPLALGYLWMLWDPRKQTWHDKVARSLVVKAPR